MYLYGFLWLEIIMSLPHFLLPVLKVVLVFSPFRSLCGIDFCVCCEVGIFFFFPKWKGWACYSTPLFKNFQTFQPSLELKSKFLKWPEWPSMTQPVEMSLTSSPTFQGMMVSLLFLKHSQNVPTPGPLNLIFFCLKFSDIYITGSLTFQVSAQMSPYHGGLLWPP